MQISAQHFAEVVESFKAIEASSNASDKRRFSRFTVVAKVQVLAHGSGRTYAALTRDVSLEGLGLMQSVSMKQGEQFSVALSRLKGGPLIALCTVMHARELAEGIWGIGAHYISVTAQDPNAKKTDPNEAKRIADKMLD
jgi:hypothetical protein